MSSEVTTEKTGAGGVVEARDDRECRIVLAQIGAAEEGGFRHAAGDR